MQPDGDLAESDKLRLRLMYSVLCAILSETF